LRSGEQEQNCAAHPDGQGERRLIEKQVDDTSLTGLLKDLS
jgi:hypothetical protein